MTYKEFNEDMQELKRIHKNIDKVYDDITKLFGTYFCESPLYEVMDEGVTYAVNLIIRKYKDEAEWISWFIYENEWGNNKHEAGTEGKMEKITTIKQLWKLIKE